MATDQIVRNESGFSILKPWQAYAFAVVATASTLGLRLILHSQLGGQPTLVIFTVPIMLSAYLGGLRGGLFATALTYLAASYYLLPPINSFLVASGAERWQQFFLGLAGVVISFVNEALHRARRRADVAVREHQHAAAALRVSEAGLRDAQRSAHIGSWELDVATGDVRASAEIFRIFQRDPTLPLPRFREQRGVLYSNDDWERLDAALKETLRSGAPYDLTLQAKRVDETTLWIVSRGEAVRDSAGAIVGLRGTAQDVTEAHRAELALEESEARYRALVDWSPDAIAVHRDGQLIFVNPAALRLFGASSAAEVLYAPILDFVDPDSRDLVIERTRESRERGLDTPMVEVSLVALDGTRRFVEVQGRAIVYDGEPARLATLRDVSERKAHEVEIERLNRLYAALSHVNQAIVRMPSREDLFRSVCNILIEHGGVRMAWIGWHDPMTSALLPVSRCGDDSGYLERIRVFSNDQPGGPSALAFRNGRPYVCNDVSADPATLPWREELGRAAFNSFASFPIHQKGVVSGLMNVYATETNFFKDKEIALLAEAAHDISFALDNIEREDERRRSDEAALASAKEAEDVRDALDQHALVGVTDARGRITFANDKFCAVSGYSREELIGKDHRIINSGHHSKEFMRELWCTIAGGWVWHGELKNRTKQGEFYWVDTTIVPFLNGDGTPRQYMAIRAVITERKDAELEVRRERDRAQRYLDTAQVILLAIDLEGRITLVNRYACSVLGWTADELLGRDFIERCVPERLRAAARRRLASVHTLPNTRIAETSIVTKTGEERLIEWSVTLQRDDDGCVVGTLSSGADLTERRLAVQALRTAEERMRFALANANVGIWDIDYTTGVLEWSELLEAQYGLAPKSFDGRFESFIAVVHPDDRAALLATVGEAMKSGEDFTTLNRSLWPDGTTRFLSGAGRVMLGANGEPVRGIGISQDITDRRLLEEQFQQAQKMDAIGRLAGGVAHDFNNLLTVILGFCELLLLDLRQEDPHRQDIVEIHRAGVSAAGLTRQLLAFSRKQIIQPIVLDLNTVVEEMRSMVGRLIGEDVKIVLGLQASLGAVKADRAQVEQVIMNLSVNARDAMLKGGTLTIETADVDLDADYSKAHLAVPPGRYVMVTVSDTGTGMAPEVQARLFEPFFTTKEVGKGTGLGLATVHGIVARNGGTVQVYSELGMGTSFKVYFPLVSGVDAQTETPLAVLPPLDRTNTVLLVEDAQGLRELAKRMLERHGYRVLVAANADEAIRLCSESETIDVLLTDVVMPGLSGPDLAKRLVDLRPSLKVIYMSGYTDDAIVQHGVLSPGIALLNKPFTSEALGRKIREALDR